MGAKDGEFQKEQRSLYGGDNISEKNIREIFPEIIHKSKAIEELLTMVRRIAVSDSFVLILGESGTGKELIASSIHRLSPRSHKCFVAINCSAIPEHLLEAELFGYEKGAFTGADRRRIGHFAAANDGTIFFDEIGDMPLLLQAKLLRVLQEKKFMPLGSRNVVRTDIRVLAATHRDLSLAIKEQSFRLDLYYRLNVLPVRIPALRERSEDTDLLLDHFVEQNNRLHSNLCQEASWFSPECKEILRAYDWPGNVRQLQNLVERLVVTCGGGRIDPEHLPAEFLEKAPAIERQGAETIDTQGFKLAEYLLKMENKLIMEALQKTNNNKNQAAQLLGVNRTTLVEKIKKRGLLPKES